MSGTEGVAEMGGWSSSYRVSRDSLNAMTHILSTELADDGVLGNSACPGFVITDTGGPTAATKPTSDHTAGIVWLATLSDHRPTRDFFRGGRTIAL